MRCFRPLVDRFPRVAMTYRLLRDGWRLSRAPEETPLGFRFIGEQSMVEGTFETRELPLIKQCLREVDVLINIGANVGYYCCLALKHGKRVIAFEPIDLNLRYLYRNIAANQWHDKIEIFPLALSNRSGIAEIFGGGTGASLIKGWAGNSPEFKRWVPLATLDLVLGEKFAGQRCLVIVDIEGAEDRMLERANGLLTSSPKPIWMVEIPVIGGNQAPGTVVNPRLVSTFGKFWDNGYEAWTADAKPRLVTRSEVESVASSGRDSLLTWSFLFLEKGRKIELPDVVA